MVTNRDTGRVAEQCAAGVLVLRRDKATEKTESTTPEAPQVHRVTRERR